jgi:hypothetical protein
MTTATRTTALAIATTMLVAGCAKHGAKVSSTNVAPRDAKSDTTETQPAVAEGQHGSRRMKNLDVPVLVDGEQVAVLRHGELPTALVAHDDAANGISEKRYFRFTEYFAAIGVDVSKIKAVHFQANHDRVASLEGSELRAQSARFVFDFLGGDEGMVKSAYDTTGLKNAFHSSEMYAVSVFVKKDAPKVDTSRSCYVVEGKCNNALAYVDGKVPTGTRIYADGKLVGMAKRRTLSDAIVMGRDGDDYKYSVAKFVTALGADADHATAIDLLQGDDVVARFDASEWQKDSAALSFRLPKHNHGKIRINVPATVQAKSDSPANREALVTAIIVHHRSVKATELAPISDESAPTQVASDQGEEGMGEHGS